MIRHAPLLLLLTYIASCSKSEIYIPPELREHPIDNKITLNGSMCAEKASTLDAFLKIMFIIDRSNSMVVTDPSNRRVDAVREVIMRFVEDPTTYRLQPGVEFALLSFYGDITVHTRDKSGLPGFTSDGRTLLSSLMSVANPGANTSYEKALSTAFLMLDSDMARLPDIARARSRYQIIFLSDGMPYPNNCSGEANSPTAAVNGVKNISQLSAMHRVPIEFSTAFVTDPRAFIPGNASDSENDCLRQYLRVDPLAANNNESLGHQTRALLMRMASVGGGSFAQFENGDAISFQSFELAKARRMYALSQFTVFNTGAIPNGDSVEADTDSDGLSDREEDIIGSRSTLADSDGDGINDFIEWRFRSSGLNPLDPSDTRCTEADMMDTDGDGLRDCEEMLIGTSRKSVDTDNDGITDDVELKSGGNPRSATPLQDSELDADNDGGSDANELRWHTDPKVDDAGSRADNAYNYLQAERTITDGQACYDFSVSNIQLGSARAGLSSENLPPPNDRAGWNRIMLYFAEAPYDDPLHDLLYRVACVEARFIAERDLKTPPGGRFELPMRRPSHTYDASPIYQPNNTRCNMSVNSDCGLNTRWCRLEDDGSCRCYRPPTAVGEPLDGVYVGLCPACSDSIDNDGDGKTDYPNDPDCFDSMDNDESPSTACKDGVDNDGDGLIDWPLDPGCQSAYDIEETDPTTLPECSDHIDNDGNGLVDFPADPGCYAASDPNEELSLTNIEYACSNGLDDDGDGLIDFDGAGNPSLIDEGCENGNDVDESGPSVCFYCELATDNRPNQCDLASSRCRPRSGAPPSGACNNRDDCRGSPCVNGSCVPCIRNSDCDTSSGAGDGICSVKHGWCLSAGYTPKACTNNADCAGFGDVCDTELGYCPVDPFAACRDERDCKPGDLCSEERGFCLTSIFTTLPCGNDMPCPSGTCDEKLGWCLPSEDAQKCHHNDLCPYGTCLTEGYCDQQTFVEPTKFDPQLDCLRAH
ncbi:MAG: VWA domain-containing protein [Deltaproteobacteria bacterium]|nr:VWA domain-containing protein [Deltaproteobacteria bacterium]